ncbi:response regulator transcription factor [Rhodococcus tukisamuensis]|uniref:DNA-binding transcriptional regulator, CsgD family n=1 Tax=Rhodococcus tukisamuensis TaxID=168276 RepID=A0A1G6PH33_9NOCA|nr:helix-turn-helix transcriptional regulator [Rhodococcus tukisamuensis]SDC78806.1 DNA-binding transcriptional regulator, CsgD family [Rhodococcus tukisamuensis]
MTPVQTGARLSTVVRDAASAAESDSEFREVVLDAICDRVPSDGAILCSVDPAVLVPTAVAAAGYDDVEVVRGAELATALEYGEVPAVNSFASLLRRTRGIRTIGEATGGKIRESRPYRELLAPLGMRDHVRMVLRARDGVCWGICDLARSGAPGFDDAEVESLARVLRTIGDGLRTSLLRGASRVAPETPDGPAVVVIGADNEVETMTPAAADYVERLGWGRPDQGVPVPVRAAALRARTADGGSVVLRAHTGAGEWVLLRAGRIGQGRIVLTLEQARLPEIVSLVVAAYGLTPREAEVLEQVLAGRTRDEIGRRLFISPYTAADHLKSIFAKTGVHSRRSLVAHLVHTEYLPRLGQELRPDGWFAGLR